MSTRRTIALVMLFVIPAIMTLPYLVVVATEYGMASNPVTQFPLPTEPASFPSSVPSGIVNLAFTLHKQSLQDNWYQLDLIATLNSNQTQVVTWASCSDGHCGNISPFQANPSPMDNVTVQTFSWTATYKGWSVVTAESTAFEEFTPYGFPLDRYVTHTYYFSWNKGLMLSKIQLDYDIPSPFIASFVDIHEVPAKDLPKDLQNDKDLINQEVVSFRVAMIRSAADLVLSVLYGIFPILTIYELAVLSALSIEALKDRLTIYVGTLFSVFAYFLTLRQLLPPYPTYLEGLVGVGMISWILFEAVKSYLTL